MTPEQIKSRYELLKGNRRVVEQAWQAIEKFVVPYRGEFFRTEQQETEIDWRKRDIYDDTAVKACRRLAANLNSNLTNPYLQWFNLQFRNKELNSNQEAKEWLEDAVKRVHRTLQESNFDLEIGEAYTDLCSFGTSVIVEEAESDIEWKGVSFQAVPVRDIFFEEDAKGNIKRFYRRLEYTPLQMIDKFGEDGVPDDVKQKAEGTSSDQKEEIIFCIYERTDKKDADTSGMLAPEARPWAFKYILVRGSVLLGDEGGYYEIPSFVIRFNKVSGSMWGFSPAHVALADILTLNELVYLDQRALEKAVDPSNLTTENGLMSDLDLEPGGLTVVSDMDGVKPYQSGARFDVSRDRINDLRISILEAFYGDELELKESPQMTATEVERRWQIMQKALGPTVGRIASDALAPIIQRTFNILMRAGQLPEIPEAIREAAGEDGMDIEYTGPIPRSQKQDLAGSIEQWLGGIAQIGEIFPEALAVPDVGAIVREVGQLKGVPANLMHSKAEIEDEEQKKKDAMAEQGQLENQRAKGEVAEQAGKGMQALEGAGMDPAQVIDMGTGQHMGGGR